MKNHYLNAVLASVSLLALASPALAQSDPASGASDVGSQNGAESGAPDVIGDIIVTAQRRSERLQDVPVTITAVSADKLTERNITSVMDLPRVAPTLKTATAVSSVSTRFSIRGLGTPSNSTAEPSVATFVDGVYIPRAAAVYGSMVDLAGVEVLSGPQGTLFGRNASVGVINLRTGEPTNELSGRLAAEVGTGQRYRLEGVINVPTGENSALRIAGLAQLFHGYWNFRDNKKNGLDDYAIRASYKTELTPNLTWTVRGDYSQSDGAFIANSALLPETLTPTTLANYIARTGVTPDTNINDKSSDSFVEGYDFNMTHRGVSSTLGLDFGDGFALQLINSYRLYRTHERDGDGASLPVPVTGRNTFWRSESNTHELQLTSPKDVLLDGRLNFVAGLFYFGDSLILDYKFNVLASFCTVLLPPAAQAGCLAGPKENGASYRFDQRTDSYAAYFQSSYKIIDPLELTLGIRYSRDEKTGLFTGILRNPGYAGLQTNEVTNLRFEGEKFTYRANLAYRFTPRAMVFATYSTGFKSGGFNSGNSSVVLGQQRVFQPETVQNYEVGFKFETDDRFLTFNATAYRMDVANYQERAQVGATAIVRNVGSLRHQGVEAQTSLNFSERFQADASIAYLDSKFLSYPNAPGIPGISATQDLTGAPLTYAPEVSGNVGATYTLPFANGARVALRSDLSFTSEYAAGSSVDNNPFAVQDGYALWSARLTYFSADDRWSLAAFADNITDKRYCSQIGSQVFDAPLGLRNATTGTAQRCYVAAPRTIGARASIKF